jgi:hypothetical protein
MSEDESSSEVFDEYDNDCHLDFHTKRNQKHKIFVKKVKKQSIYDVKDSQHVLVKKINSLEITERSKQLLTKLVVNRQLEEIRSVRQGTNSIVLHAKVNREHEIYRDLESNDVMMKIYIRKNHKKADVDSAKNIEMRTFIVGTKYHLIQRKSLKLFSMENISVIEMICGKHLIQMVEENPREVRRYFREILEALRALANCYFWTQKASMTDILWHEGRWVFLDYIDSRTQNEVKTSIGANMVLLFRIFMGFGMTTNEIQLEFTRILTHFGRSYNHFGSNAANVMSLELVELFQVDETKTELDWDHYQVM